MILREGDYLKCKKTIYRSEDMQYKERTKTQFLLFIIYSMFSSFAFYKKGKKYKIKNSFGTGKHKIYFIDDYPIPQEWIENVFYTDKDIRKLKLDKLQKLYGKM